MAGSLLVSSASSSVRWLGSLRVRRGGDRHGRLALAEDVGDLLVAQVDDPEVGEDRTRRQLRGVHDEEERRLGPQRELDGARREALADPLDEPVRLDLERQAGVGRQVALPVGDLVEAEAVDALRAARQKGAEDARREREGLRERGDDRDRLEGLFGRGFWSRR